MRGITRTQVIEATTLREHDAKQAERAEAETTAATVAALNLMPILHDLAAHGDALSAVTFDHPDHGTIVSISYPGNALPLWATPGGVHGFARALNNVATKADQRNQARLQAALEQDQDRREELIRLGHEA